MPPTQRRATGACASADISASHSHACMAVCLSLSLSVLPTKRDPLPYARRYPEADALSIRPIGRRMCRTTAGAVVHARPDLPGTRTRNLPLTPAPQQWQPRQAHRTAAKRSLLVDCGRIRTYAANAIRFRDVPLNHSGTQSSAVVAHGRAFPAHAQAFLLRRGTAVSRPRRNGPFWELNPGPLPP